MREFYVWTKRNPYYRGPFELDDAIELAKESAYISQDKAKDMRRQYIKGERWLYTWRFQYGFSELAEITVSPPKAGGTF